MKGGRGDAARIWHCLDASLEKLREARLGLEEAGREDLVEHLEELLEKTEFGQAEAEREVATLLGDGREESRW